MRAKPFPYLVRPLIVCLLAPLALWAQTAQEQRPRAKLSVRVVTYAGATPVFYPLADEDKSSIRAVIEGFRRLPSARWSSGLPVQRVVLHVSREGAAARAQVYVERGGETSPESVKVAEHLLWEGREYMTAGLAEYGVEPMNLAVVRRADVEFTPPRVDNRTRAVEVSEIKVHSEVPSFELSLRNASDKEISAVEIQEYRGWEPKGQPPMYDWKRMTPVKAGKSWSVTLEFGWNYKATREGHAVEPPDRVVINSALFSDGSYEGSSLFAARAEAFRSGSKTQLARVLEILRGWGDVPAPDTREAAKELAGRVGLLECTADWAAITELASHYAVVGGQELDRIKASMESGMAWQQQEVLKELNGFTQNSNPASDPHLVRNWLKQTRKKYEQRLASLTPTADSAITTR
jgi:hypothetical protein